MNKLPIKGTDILVSQLICGCAGDVMQQGLDNSSLLDASVDGGINTFDTARQYGMSENSLGQWMKKRNNRDKVVVLTKGCHPKNENLSVHRVSKAAIDEDLTASLKALDTDYIDIYLLHRDDTSVSVSELMDTLEEYKKQGKVRCYGVSNWTMPRLLEAKEYAEKMNYSGFLANSPNYSLGIQVNDPWESGSEAISISGQDGKIYRDFFIENNIPVFAYSSLCRGLFSGKFSSTNPEKATQGMDMYAMRGYFSDENIKRLSRCEELAKEKGCTVAQMALAYLMNQKLQVHPIVSYSDEKHLNMNLESVNIKLSGDEIAFLEG